MPAMLDGWLCGDNRGLSVHPGAPKEASRITVTHRGLPARLTPWRLGADPQGDGNKRINPWTTPCPLPHRCTRIGRKPASWPDHIDTHDKQITHARGHLPGGGHRGRHPGRPHGHPGG